MAFSKSFNVNKCRNGLVQLRGFSFGENADRLLISKRLPQLKMSLNQWKIISQLKDQLARTPTDKTQIMLVLNRELVNILKKLPSMSGQITTSHLEHTKSNETNSNNTEEKNLVPTGSSTVNTSQTKLNKEESNFVSDSISAFPQVLNDLKNRFSTPALPVTEEKNKWKTKPRAISDLSINARTRYVLNSVLTSESETSRAKRLEDLVDHFLLYPEAVDIAIKNGGIRILLNIKNRSQDKDSLEPAREALTMLGYIDPLPNYGIRILSIDGGGIRGLLVMEMLLKLEELTGKKVYELFDYICGVSTGSVIACTIGATGKSIGEVSNLYKDLSNKIFTQNAFFGARSLIWNHGYYDTALWEEILKQHVGTTKLIKTSRKGGYPKIGAISSVFCHDQVLPFIFRNYELPYRVISQHIGSYKHELWEAARASAAAPTYFEEFHLGDYLHQDGGILVNNPTAVAVHEAKQLWPNSPIQCVVSFGTGRIDPVITASIHESKKTNTKQTSWKEKFSRILISATDTEAVHTVLNDLLPPSVYFRFNPYLTEMLSMDEYQTEKLAILQNDARMYMRRNEEKFQEAASALVKPRTNYQKLSDWVALKAAMFSDQYR